MIKAAEAMVKCLENEGIKVVFGYPGAAICPFYDELSHSDIKHILVRHEANGGHSASVLPMARSASSASSTVLNSAMVGSSLNI